METRILIPEGLKIVVIDKGEETTKHKRVRKICASSSTEEEKPSSSSGHFETSEQEKSYLTRRRTRSSRLASPPRENNYFSFDEDDKHDHSSSRSPSSSSCSGSESSFDNDASEFSDKEIIGSSENRSTSRQKRKRHESSQVGSSSGVKICASRVIEPGTMFTANDGDVHVVHLKETPAVPKEDIRFLFGCFEAITPVPSTPSADTHHISSATTSSTTITHTAEVDGACSNFIRLCNWVRFLRRAGKHVTKSAATTSSSLPLILKKSTTSESEEDNESSVEDKDSQQQQHHQLRSRQSKSNFPNKRGSPSTDTVFSGNRANDSSLVAKRSDKQEMSHLHYHNFETSQERKTSSNLIARVMDGRPVFEVTRRLVPGTELLTDFDMSSILTQPLSSPSSSSSSAATSPFYSPLMIPRLQMMMMMAGGMPPAPQPVPMSISSSTAPASLPCHNISPASIVPPFVTSSSFLNLKKCSGAGSGGGGGADNSSEMMKARERDENSQHFFPFYHPYAFHFHHHPALCATGSATNPGKDKGGSFWNTGSVRKVAAPVKQEKTHDSKSNAASLSDGPLDLSKLPGSNDHASTSILSSEPLKVGTPFDSPDSNDEDFKPVRIKKEPVPFPQKGNSGSSSSGSSTLFSIRNVLKNQLSPPPSGKLFQPYDSEVGRDFGRRKGNLRSSVTPPPSGASTGTARGLALTTPPSSSHSPMVVRHPPVVVAPILRTRGRERSLLPCEVCGKAFDRPSLLKRHLRTHTGEKPHICDVCSKGFSTSSSLNTHRRIHSGEKPHQCPICGKRFTASSNLYYHRMTHNKEKPHKCLLCGKSFPTPGDLKSHQYVHSGSWPYTCPVCHRGFSKQTNLRNHLLLHSGMSSSSSSNKPGDKPHTCQICDKKFTLACNLRAHVRTHEESDPVSSSCAVCKRTFLSSMNMIVNGHCRNCLLSMHSSSSGLSNSPSSLIGGGGIRRDSVTSPPSSHLSSVETPVVVGGITGSLDSSMVAHSRSGAPLSALTQPLTTSHPFGSLALPQLSALGLPGLGSIPGGTPAGLHYQSSPAASLFRTAGREATPATNPFLEQLFEWNYRFAKETAGLSMMQQKLLESQVLAAQLMTSHGLGVGGSAIQDILRLRGAAGTDAFSQLDTVGVASSENKFMQR